MAERIADQFTSPENLATWLQGAVQEWRERDSQMMSLAAAGEAYADSHQEASVEASVFRVINDQLSDIEFAQELTAGIKQLAKMADKGGING